MNVSLPPSSPRRRLGLWTALAALAVATAVFWIRRAPALAAPAPRASGTATAAPRSVDPAAAARVEAEVAARNRLEPNETAAFENAGWKMVAAPPPDPRLIGLDPSLVDGREDELRVQIASTAARPADAANLAAIARRAHEEATRYAAVEALGRTGGQAAQQALYSLLTDGSLPETDPARQAIPSLLRPSALDDPWATTLAHLLDSPGLTAVEKQQLAFTLAIVGLRDGMTLAPEVLAQLSPEALRLIDSATALARAGRAPSPTP